MRQRKVIHDDGETELFGTVRDTEYSGNTLVVNMKDGRRKTFKHGNLVN